ncbi:unnamed protein product [Prunus armeniaca]
MFEIGHVLEGYLEYNKCWKDIWNRACAGRMFEIGHVLEGYLEYNKCWKDIWNRIGAGNGFVWHGIGAGKNKLESMIKHEKSNLIA